ncbi:MAG: hypothetical protein RSF68_01435 [Myroides sp.]
MLVKYFEIIDTISSYNTKKITPYLVFFYFPIIISVYVYTSAQNNDLVSLISILVLLGLVFFSPMLMIPSWYRIRKKDFFAFKQLHNHLKSASIESFSFNKENLGKTIEYAEKEVKHSKLLYLYSYLFRGKWEQKDLFVPNKKMTKAGERKIMEFYKTEAGKYFETIDYNAGYLLDLLKDQKEIGIDHKIKLNDDLENHKIKSLISDLKGITGINEIQLAKLFSSYEKKMKEHKSLKFNSIKSSDFQRNKRIKS